MTNDMNSNSRYIIVDFSKIFVFQQAKDDAGPPVPLDPMRPQISTAHDHPSEHM